MLLHKIALYYYMIFFPNIDLKPHHYHNLMTKDAPETEDQAQASNTQRGPTKRGYLGHSKNITFLRQTAGPLIVLLLLSLLRALSIRCRLGTSLLLLNWLRCRLGLRLVTAVQSRRVSLGDVLVERLALDLGNLQLKSGGLAGAVGTLITSFSKLNQITLESIKHTAKVPAPQALPPWISFRFAS